MLNKVFDLIIGLGMIKIGIDIIVDGGYESFHAGKMLDFTNFQYPAGIAFSTFGIYWLWLIFIKKESNEGQP